MTTHYTLRPYSITVADMEILIKYRLVRDGCWCWTKGCDTPWSIYLLEGEIQLCEKCFTTYMDLLAHHKTIQILNEEKDKS